MNITSLMTKKRNSLFRIFLCHLLFFLFLALLGQNYRKLQRRTISRECNELTAFQPVFTKSNHTFAFLGYRVKVHGSTRNSPLFKCSAQCLFNDCSVEVDVLSMCVSCVGRNPKKGSSPFPVATYATSDHTTAFVLYFLGAFQTDHAKRYAQKNISPLWWYAMAPWSSWRPYQWLSAKQTSMPCTTVMITYKQGKALRKTLAI